MIIPGLLQHLLLTLRLNLRSRAALVYGYVVPIFFLVAFGSVFRFDLPPLWRELGQLLTISTLGGACFGMPTSMVAERERGVWRRYHLLPQGLRGLVASTMIARFFIVLSAAIMQIALAALIYRTPLPLHPWQLLVAFVFVALAFEGMGLVIAMLADTVPAVQALGQCIFLPMIMIGGVGVPLRSLPPWAQTLAGYLPGRYAVEAIQACVNGNGLRDGFFSLAALTVIGVAAIIAGTKLFRWDVGQKIAARAKVWTLLALLAWAAVGVVAQISGHLKPVQEPVTTSTRSTDDLSTISGTDIADIKYDDLEDDGDVVTPLAHSLKGLDPNSKQRMDSLARTLDQWPPANKPPLVQRIRNTLSVAAVADIVQDPNEAEVAYVVLERLRASIAKPELEKALAVVILHPDGGTVLTKVTDLGIDGAADENIVRERSAKYAKKLLGRLVGKLPS